MKYSGIEWIGEIPDNWKIRKVKHCFYISKKQAHEENPTILSLARAGVKIRDISNNEGQLAASYENYNPVQPGDLLLNPMDLYSGANCSLSEISGVISPAYVNLRKHTKLNPKFFDYYFKTQYWAMAMFAHGKGVSFDNRWTMNVETVLNYYLPFPTYEEQNNIVEKINQKIKEIDSLIEIENRQIDKLKEYKQAVITEAVTKGLDKNVPMKDSGVEWIGKIPEGWEIVPLKNISEIKTGSTPSTQNQNYFNGDINWYTPGDFINDYIFQSTRTITQFAIEDCEISLFPENTTLLIGIGGTAGKVTLIKKEGYSNQQITAIIAKTNCDRLYLYYLMLTCTKYLKDNALYTTLPIINNQYLSLFKVCKPSLKEQQDIAKNIICKCTDIDRLIEIKRKKIDQLDEYKKSLIYEYVTGKKEVC